MQRRQLRAIPPQIWRSACLAVIGSLIPASAASAATPLPWEWVLDLQERSQQQNCPLWDLRRSPPLDSPSGRWQVYSRLELQVDPRSQSDQLTSVLFALDRQTDRLQAIRSVSIPPTAVDLDFVMLVPMGWQQEQLLIREHSGLFQSGIAEDQAVIWDPRQARIQVIQPPPLQITELLDWDPEKDQHVLFAVGQFGENPSVISLGETSEIIPRSIPIDAFPNSGFTPSTEETTSIPWQPGLPQITGPICGS